MRTAFLGFAALVTAFAVNAAPTAAQAYSVYPWCAYYRNGSTNCYFATLAQCRAAVSGVGGYCGRNSFYGGGRRY